MITTLYYRRELRLYINCWVKKILYYCHIIIYLIVGLFLPILISSLFVSHQLVYLQLIGIARSHKSTHSPCQQRCQCCPHWYRRQLQHFSYCRRSFHSTMRLPGEAQLHESLAYESLQHVAWPTLPRLSPWCRRVKLLHNLPTISPSPILWPLSPSPLTRSQIGIQLFGSSGLLSDFSMDLLVIPATSRKEGYIKIATIVEDTANARTPWMAKLLIVILTIWTDLVGSNSGRLSLPFHYSFSHALCSRCQRSFVPCRWHSLEEASKSKIWNRRMLCWWSALGGKPPWSQSSVLMSEVQRNSLRHRRPSCFTFHSNACFTTDLACTPQNSSFVKALHSLSQVCLTILTHFISCTLCL